MASAAPSNRPSTSCTRCANRKVKCDRLRPCTACVKHGVDCSYHALRPIAKKTQRVADELLLERMKYYEKLLQAHGIGYERIPVANARLIPTKTPLNEEPQVNLGISSRRSADDETVICDAEQSAVVENPLWNRVARELSCSSEFFKDASNSGTQAIPLSLGLASIGDQGNSTPEAFAQPSGHEIQCLWHAYKCNVDPIAKIVHVPTLEPAVQQAINSMESVPQNFHILLFAIYSAAVMSMQEDDCQTLLCQPRRALLIRYVTATGIMLERVDFTGTSNLIVLQALVLHIFSIRELCNSATLWSLSGLAIRIAQRMGLDRDGEKLGLSPFETEIRRRLWWVLKLHDNQAGELCGMAKFRDFNLDDLGITKWPSDLDDDEIYLEMPRPRSNERDRLTDSCFLALRGQLVSFAKTNVAQLKQQGAQPRAYNLDMLKHSSTLNAAIKGLSHTLETRFIRLCDPNRPLHLLTLTLARFSLATIQFLTNHPRRFVSETPLPTRHSAFDTAMTLLELHYFLQTEPRLKCFSWNAAFYLPWHALIHVLDVLRAESMFSEKNRAWTAVENTWKGSAELKEKSGKPLCIAVGRLSMAAWQARMESDPADAPDFIRQLEQEELRKAQVKQAYETSSSNTAISVDDRMDEPERMSHPMAAVLPTLSKQPAISTSSQFQAMPPPVSSFQTSKKDPFWFIDVFGYCKTSSSTWSSMPGGHPMNVTPEDGFSINNEEINWGQWDAWVAEANMTGQQA